MGERRVERRGWILPEDSWSNEKVTMLSAGSMWAANRRKICPRIGLVESARPESAREETMPHVYADPVAKLLTHGGYDSEEGGDLEIQTNYESVSLIKAVPEELRQVFVNVIANAVQAMKYKGTLSLSTQMVDGTVQVRIRDTGPGIPKAYLPKVFDPFFTTKSQGEGSGLGLTVANRIITKHGGKIHMESEEGKGATCVISLPVPEFSSTGETRP